MKHFDAVKTIRDIRTQLSERYHEEFRNWGIEGFRNFGIIGRVEDLKFHLMDDLRHIIHIIGLPGWRRTDRGE